MQSFTEFLDEFRIPFAERYIDFQLYRDRLLFSSHFSLLLDDFRRGALSYSGPPLTLEQAEIVVESCFMMIDAKYPFLAQPGNPFLAQPTQRQLDLPARRQLAKDLCEALNRDTEPHTRKAASVARDRLASETNFSHSDDYRTIRFAGREYSLTTNQALIIETLNESRKNGHRSVSKETLLSRIGSPQSRLRDSFRSGDGPALWGKLIVKTPKTRDMYTLKVQ